MRHFILFLTTLAALAHATGQSNNAYIIGSVTDETGSSMTGVEVAVLESDRTTSSNADGAFMFEALAAGRYVLRFSFPGYEPLTLQVQALPGYTRMDPVMLVPAVAPPPNQPAIEPLIDPLLGSVLLDPAAVATVTSDARAPFAHENLSADEIQSRDAAVDLPWLLRLTPSLVVTSDAGAGVGYTSMRVRGSDQTRINVTINGIPLNDAESHQVYWVDLPDLGSSVDGLQIQRGVGTSTNGPGAFGATVAVNTLSFDEEAGGRAVLGAGSFGTRRSSISWSSGDINDSGLRLEGRLSRILSDGYVDRATSDLASAQLGIAQSWESGHLSYTAMLGHERTYQAWYGVPEIGLYGTPEEITAWAANSYEYGYGSDTTRIADLIENGRRHNYYQYQDEVDDYRQDHHQLHLEQLAGDWRLSLTGHWTIGGGYYEQFRPDDGLGLYGIHGLVIGGDTISTGDVVRRRWLENDFYGGAFSAEQRWDAGMLTLGGGAFQYVGDHFGEVVWLEHAGDLLPGSRYYDGVGRKQDANVFARVVKELAGNQVRLQAEGQIRSVTYTATGNDNDLRAIAIDDAMLFFNPKLGFDWMPSSATRAFASVAVANREPSRTDYVDGPAGGDVRPERLTDFELGLTHRFVEGPGARPLQVDLVGYHMAYRDQLVLTGALNDVGSPLRTNVDKSFRQGLEFITDWGLTRHLNWSTNLTVSANRIENFTETLYDYGLATTEVNIAHGTTDIAFSPGVVATNIFTGRLLKERGDKGSWLGTAEWAMRHVGRQFLDNTSNEARSLPAYTVNDLRLRSTFYRSNGQEWSVNLFANNVLDAMYSANGWTYSYRLGGPETEITENYVYPQAGRHFMLSLECTF
jgi:iron complex outermembrane receptor protein